MKIFQVYQKNISSLPCKYSKSTMKYCRTTTPTSPLSLPPTISAHQALGSPSGRAGAKRLRGLTVPIPPTNHPQNHRTDSPYETTFHHKLPAHPSPPPFGRYLSRRERQEPGGNFRRLRKPKYIIISIYFFHPKSALLFLRSNRETASPRPRLLHRPLSSRPGK